MASFPVDTKGKCFLCLKIIKKPFKSSEENEEDEEEHEEEDEGVEFNFQRVHHFLKLRPKKVLNEFKQTAVLSSQALKSKNFSVVLCDECVAVAGRISDLCEELESIQMLLDYSIREMSELIRTSDEERTEAGYLPKIAVLLRKHTKQHCDSTIRRIPTAKVKLQLIDDGEDEELELEEEEESNENLSDPSEYFQEDTLDTTEVQNINSDFRFSRLEFERSEENSEHPYACPFCSSKFTMVDTLRQHAVNSHLYLLFYSAKLPFISNMEFKSCCEKLLKDQTSASTIAGGYQCSQCNTGFKVMKQFHNHLFLLHFDSILLPKLADIQNEFHDDQPSILKQALSSSSVPSKPGTQFSCSFCSRIFPSSWNLKLHSSSFHLDQFLTAAKLEHISDDKFQAICSILYEKETDLKSDGERRYSCSHCSSSYSARRILMLHLLDTHYNTLIEKLTEMQMNPSRTKLFIATPGNRPSNQKYVCKPCDIEFNNLLMYKRHKLKVHPEQASYTCASCGLKLFTQAEWIKHRTLYCTMRLKSSATPNKTPSVVVKNKQTVNGRGNGGDDADDLEEMTHPAVQEILSKLRTNSERVSDNRILCPICSKNNGVTMFNEARQLVRHVVCFHTEHFFLSLKKPEMSISTFSGFCTQLFGDDKFPSETDAASGIRIFNCSYCSAMFNEKRSIQRHQIQVHYSTLCDELEKAMQKSGNASAKPINAPPATSKAFGAAAAQVVKGFIPISSKPSQPPEIPQSKRGIQRCPRCQKFFSKTTNIQRHMNSLGCQQGTSAPRRTTMTNLGPDSRVYPCQYCGTLLASNPNRNRHIRMHCPLAKEAQAQSNYVTNPTESGNNDLDNSNWEEENEEDSYVLSYEDDEALMDYKEEPVECPTDNEPGSSSSFAMFPGSNIEDEEEGVGEEMGSVEEDMNFVNIGELGQNEEDGNHLDELPYEDPLGM